MARTEIPSYTTNQLVTAAQGNLYWKNNEAAHWQAIGEINSDFDLIQEVVLTVDGVFDVTSIPQTFKSLNLVISARAAAAAASSNALIRFNNDSGSNYDWQRLYASSTTVTASEGRAQTSSYVGNIYGNSVSAGLFSGISIDIPNYTKTHIGKAFVANSQSGIVLTVHGNWRLANAINRITIYSETGTNLLAGSVLSLYGRR